MDNENFTKVQKEPISKSSDNPIKKEDSKKTDDGFSFEKDATIASCDSQEIEKENSSISSEKAQKSGSPGKVPNKFIANWKHACDKTKVIQNVCLVIGAKFVVTMFSLSYEL